MKGRKKWGIIISLLTLVMLLGGCQSQEPVTEVVEPIDLSIYPQGDYFITPQEVLSLLGSEDLVLLDCNKPDYYGKEHIPGAISIGLHAFSDKVGKPRDSGWGTIKS